MLKILGQQFSPIKNTAFGIIIKIDILHFNIDFSAVLQQNFYIKTSCFIVKKFGMQFTVFNLHIFKLGFIYFRDQ